MAAFYFRENSFICHVINVINHGEPADVNKSITTKQGLPIGIGKPYCFFAATDKWVNDEGITQGSALLPFSLKEGV